VVAAHYAATKAGLIGLTRHWAAELGEYGVTVNALAPGRIDTPLLKTVPAEINQAIARVTAMRRLGTPEEVADACLFFVSDQARFVTGQVLDVAGGWLMT
jgi:3-oxoacyl-[acyl-carrier protein] reductase